MKFKRILTPLIIILLLLSIVVIGAPTYVNVGPTTSFDGDIGVSAGKGYYINEVLFSTGGLVDIGALAKTDSNFIVGDGINWVAETGATARASLGLTIGTNVQAYDAGLLSLAGLTYASDSFIKVTATDVYAIRTIAETKTDLALNLVENIALSTWAGTANITTLGTIGTGAWNATLIGAAKGGTGVANNAANTLTFTGAFSLGLTLSANTALTLPASGTVAVTANKLSAFAATTSAELAGVISDETGTLKLVYSDSPVFTTQITTPIIALTGGQIAFPAAQAPSADANTLDDYEEGEWTPAFKFGGNSVDMTYDVQGGRYIKIGNLVNICGRLSLTAKGTSTGAATIIGLPFTCKNNVYAYAAVTLRLDRITYANAFQALVMINTTTISLGEITEAGVQTALDNTNFANDSNIIINVTYEVE